MDRKQAKILLTAAQYLANPGIPILGVLALRELLAPHLTETVGVWAVVLGFVVTYIAMIFAGSLGSSIERGVIAVVETVLGATAFGEPYDRWDYYGACVVFGAWYGWLFSKIYPALEKIEKDLEPQEVRQEEA